MYSERKRRNIQLRGDEHAIPTNRWVTESETWEDEEEATTDLEEGIEELEEESEETDGNKQDLPVYLVDGKPFPIKREDKKPSFQESHTRITTYLENNLNGIIRILHQQREIDSITSFLNDAVKHYLKEKYWK